MRQERERNLEKQEHERNIKVSRTHNMGTQSRECKNRGFEKKTLNQKKNSKTKMVEEGNLPTMSKDSMVGRTELMTTKVYTRPR